MVSLQCKDCTALELSHGESPFPPAIRIALIEVLNAIDKEAAAFALSQPEHSKANFDALVFERLRNRLPTAFSIDRKAQVFHRHPS